MEGDYLNGTGKRGGCGRHTTLGGAFAFASFFMACLVIMIVQGVGGTLGWLVVAVGLLPVFAATAMLARGVVSGKYDEEEFSSVKWLTLALVLGLTVACAGSLLVVYKPLPAPTPKPADKPLAVSVSVTGITGSTSPLILALNGAESIQASRDGSFPFTTTLSPGASWAITIVQPQPAGLICQGQNAQGTNAQSPVTATFTCTKG